VPSKQALTAQIYLRIFDIVAYTARILLPWQRHVGVSNRFVVRIECIVWDAGVDDPLKQPPRALLVHFDQYTGPSLCHTDDGKPVIPILRSSREFYYSNAICSRTQFPITVAYAITVHKSQGMTVHQAVLNISRKDFSLGLSYVAVSRVRTLDGILFEESFDLERFKPANSLTKTLRAADVLRRRSEHVCPYSCVSNIL
jgi:hypothetical protein